MSDEETRSVRAVLYLRVARDDWGGSDRAIAAQRHTCQRRAAELGLEVVREYVDHGSSLGLEGRPGMTQLLADLESRSPVGYIIAYGHTQISRDLELYVSVMWAVRKAGARLELAGLPHQEPNSVELLLIGRVGELQLAEMRFLAEPGDESDAADHIQQ